MNPEMARRFRNRTRFLVKWAVLRGAIAAGIGAWTGEYQIAAVAWAALTWFHIERVMETQ